MKPNPGSDAAIALGCTCPVSDNRRGEGLQTSTGRMFWFTEACPVHDAELAAVREETRT